jgi:hypothetical protein
MGSAPERGLEYARYRRKNAQCYVTVFIFMEIHEYQSGIKMWLNFWEPLKHVKLAKININ